MVTTTQRMLEEIRRPELFDAVLEEIARVRAEMGYPILVTPVSQFMVTQAMTKRDRRAALDATSPTRPSATSSGTTASSPRPSIRRSPPRCSHSRRRTSCARRGRVSLDGARARFGARISEEELLLRLVMPAEQVDAMRPLAESAAAPGRRTGRAAAPGAPAQAGDLVSARAEGRRSGGVASCVLRTFAVSCSTSTERSSTAPARTRWRRSTVPARCSTGSARSGRPFAIFTNGSHKAPAGFAADLRAAGLPVEDGQVITPLCSVQAYLERRRGAAVLGFLTRGGACGISRAAA